jgi:serine/threonine protein kinase
MDSAMTGRSVGHYRILEPLGGGGMGVVCRGEDTRLGRKVAIKFLPPTLLDQPGATERFKREARLASALNHSATIFDIGEIDGQQFIVMELMEGHTLKYHVRERALPVDELLEFAVQITDGLDAAHQSGIIHRDIKPANIFVTRRGQAKLLRPARFQWRPRPWRPVEGSRGAGSRWAWVPRRFSPPRRPVVICSCAPRQRQC